MRLEPPFVHPCAAGAAVLGQVGWKLCLLAFQKARATHLQRAPIDADLYAAARKRLEIPHRR
jgi:hypothetical protein